MRFVGLLVIISIWVLGGYLIWKWRDKNLLTISKHAASTRNASILFTCALVLSGALLYWWFTAWFKQHLGLSGLFTFLISFSILCQLMTGLFADTSGAQRQIHRIAAYSMAVSYLPLAVVISLSSKLTTLVQVICLLIGLYMAVSFTLLVLLQKARDKYLVFQALYVVSFGVLVLVAAYAPTNI